jgi:hypothetical protein
MSSNDIEETRRYYRIQNELKKLREYEAELTKIINVDLPAIVKAQEKCNADKLNKTTTKDNLFNKLVTWLKSLW